MNNFNAPVPTLYTSYYFKVAADKTGKTLYLPGNTYYNYYNQVLLSSVGDKFQVEKLNITNTQNSNVDINIYNYDANAKINVEIVDITGTAIQSAPKLMATTGLNGKIVYTYSPEGGNGYAHLKRDDAGVLVPDAKGIILKAVAYDS